MNMFGHFRAHTRNIKNTNKLFAFQVILFPRVFNGKRKRSVQARMLSRVFSRMKNAQLLKIDGWSKASLCRRPFMPTREQPAFDSSIWDKMALSHCYSFENRL